MTKLEKMAKIYRLTGIEPDSFVYEFVIMQDVKKDGWEWKDVKAQVLVKAEDCEPTDKPYYSESKLWEMLPDVIETYYSFGINKKGLGYLHDIKPEDVLHWVSFKSLHEALTELVLWCIENGHIKNVVKE